MLIPWQVVVDIRDNGPDSLCADIFWNSKDKCYINQISIEHKHKSTLNWCTKFSFRVCEVLFMNNWRKYLSHRTKAWTPEKSNSMTYFLNDTNLKSSYKYLISICIENILHFCFKLYFFLTRTLFPQYVPMKKKSKF